MRVAHAARGAGAVAQRGAAAAAEPADHRVLAPRPRCQAHSAQGQEISYKVTTPASVYILTLINIFADLNVTH